MSSAHCCRQREVGYVCQTREKTQHVLPEKYSPYPGQILGRQSVQRRGPVSCWPSQYVHSTQAAQTALAGSCPPHERWPHPKRHHLWRAGIRIENHWRPSVTLLGHLHEKHEGDRRRCSFLGMSCTRWRSTLNQHLKTREEKQMNAAEVKRIERKERSDSSRPETTLRCNLCGRVSSTTGDAAPAEQTARTGCITHGQP